jgi:peptidyl-prolyl cis-trans isomerase D
MLEVQQLQDAIVLSSFVTEQELQQRVALQRELREVEWLSLPVDRFREEIEVSATTSRPATRPAPSAGRRPRASISSTSR